jgi:predicted secreted Zn-dependent protease
MSIHTEAADGLHWRTSRTCDGGACVGVARQGDFIVVGNTADPMAAVSKFTAQEWSAFLAGVKLGDFDDLV